MDAEQAYEDFSEIANHPGDAKLLYWFLAYSITKIVCKIAWGPTSWDVLSLAHNIVSVLLGFYDLSNWQLPSEDTCHSVNSRHSLAIIIQLVHCVSDFVVFLPEMVDQPVFIWHHGILVFTSLVFPYCPGCYYVTLAYTLAEIGSASIAIDAEWRKLGKRSRGFKRLVVFGATRVTPSKVYFTLTTATGNDPLSEKKVFTVNFPICMITSVGGSALILMVNGVTWWRMYRVYMKNREKRIKLMEVLKKAC
eukprot:snap_masked-scaffold_5-processed-gene-1.53-mRNA-1 protein AED:1.00 eAED:1.00 QI:0/0/0/0/1/1/2/0/249